MELTKEIFHLGRPTAPKQSILLRAGEITVCFDPNTGFLRRFLVGDHEIMRSIYGAVRDHNWDTLETAVDDLQVQSEDRSFSIAFTANCLPPTAQYRWDGRITGSSESSIEFQFNGEALSSFRRNRIGLCALHPIFECAGRPCEVVTSQGKVQKGSFPKSISPHQPFKNISALRYSVGPGIQLEVHFEGDVFEMEDQRNWTDASFKTYSTPLDLPFPVDVQPGDTVHQRVRVALTGPRRRILPILQGRPPQISISTNSVFAKPAIGLQSASHPEPLSDAQVQRLNGLDLSHLRAPVDLTTGEWPQELDIAIAQSRTLSLPLHLAVSLGADTEQQLQDFSQSLAKQRPSISLFLIYQRGAKVTPDSCATLARKFLGPRYPNVLIAAGADTFFAELNRERPDAEATALPCFSINPQVHAFDETTLVENLAAQPATLQAATQFSQKSVVVSPITLRPRSNPNATLAAPNETPDDLPSDVDPRQMSLFAAGWTLGSIAALAKEPNLHSLTYYETTGWRGIMARESGSENPGRFLTPGGAAFPVYHLLADLAGYSRIYESHSDHPVEVQALTLVNEKNRRRVLVANLDGQPKSVRIKTGQCRARIKMLDETTAAMAMTQPEEYRLVEGNDVESVAGKIELQLLPYGLARVDIQ